ncbi:MAG: DUF4440 domain-containing protein [Acidobacteriia bacterium]|nr:DUF4440 domain-containing protein [Terriglobia bacterium]
MLLVCAAVASAACGSKGTVQDGSRAAARAQDQAAIQKLHEQDVAATLAGNPAAIAALWTDDIVLIEFGQPRQVGKQAILSARQRRLAALPGFSPGQLLTEYRESHHRGRMGGGVERGHRELHRENGSRRRTSGRSC